MESDAYARAPKETLYINNLPEKLSLKNLKQDLYAALSPYGPILDIIAKTSHAARGQAFVVFRDTADAVQAQREMNGFPFYEKPMRIAYARTKSDATAHLDGTYEARIKAERNARHKAGRESRKAKKAAPPSPQPVEPAPTDATPSLKRKAPDVDDADAAHGPNAILFVENLPDAVNEMMLSMLFQQFAGFKEARLVPARPGIAFIEYESDVQSTVALGGLQGFKITPTNLMKISYAKR